VEHWDAGRQDGDGGLDEEHRELYRLLASVLSAVAANDRGSATRLMDRLHAELEDHFAEEQGRMAELEDPALPRHREAHEAILEDFTRLRWELGHRGLSPLFRLWISTRFSDWLRFHTRTFDAALARVLRGG
jgi:hemerythrin-like metal-binding protein